MDRRGLQLIKIKDGFEIHQFAGINIVIDKTEIPEKALFWCATRQVDILNIERFLAFAAQYWAAFLCC